MKKFVSMFFLMSIMFWSALAQNQLPQLPKTNVNFMIASDMGLGGVTDKEAVAQWMGRFAEQNRIDFLGVAGDPIQDQGVKDVDDPEWKKKIEDVYTASSLHAIPWHAVAGNHEYNGSVQALIDYSQKSKRWNMPARYYTITKKINNSKDECLFIFVDTTPFIERYSGRTSASEDDIEVQLKWIETQLKSSSARWKILIGHHPVFAETNKGEAERTNMQSRLGVLLEKYGADVFICGHIHNFQHLQPAGKKVHYVVNSSAAKARPVKEIEGTIFCGSDPGFSAFTIDQETCKFFFINHEGKSIYNYTIRKESDKSSVSSTQPGQSIFGQSPRSVTYLWDSFQQKNGQFVARFNWVTDPGVNTSVLYYAKKKDFDKNGGKFTNTVSGINYTVDLSSQIAALNYTKGTPLWSGGVGVFSYAPVQSHKAETATLEPGTEYVYSVGNTASTTLPQVIKTPAAKVNTFDILFFTDAQQGPSGSYEKTLTAYNSLKETLDLAITDFPNAAFIMSGGDNVNHGFDTWAWDAFFASNQEKFAKYPFFLGVGNHEGNELNSEQNPSPVDPTCIAAYGRHNPPKNGAAWYGGGNGTQRMTAGVEREIALAGNYFFVYGNTLFLVMNHPNNMEVQQKWLQSVVKQNPTQWRVAMFHRSLFGYRITDPTTGLAKDWTDAFDAAGIDVVLMGHDHIYTRTKYYSNRKAIEGAGNGTTYITGASANTNNRSEKLPDSQYTIVTSTGNYGRAYVALSISPKNIKVTTRGYMGTSVVTLEDRVLVTDKPRKPKLENFKFPAVPAEK